MLFLVPPHRHGVGLHGQNIGRHQHGVRKQRMAGSDSLGNLVLIRMASFQKPHARNGGKKPGQLGDFRHITLPIDHRPLGVQTARQVVQSHIGCIRAKLIPIGHRGQRMIVRNEKKRVALLLQLNGRLHHSEEVADVQLAGRLNSR